MTSAPDYDTCGDYWQAYEHSGLSVDAQDGCTLPPLHTTPHNPPLRQVKEQRLFKLMGELFRGTDGVQGPMGNTGAMGATGAVGPVGPSGPLDPYTQSRIQALENLVLGQRLDPRLAALEHQVMDVLLRLDKLAKMVDPPADG